MMADRLRSTVYERTKIPDGYREHAAWQNFQVHLEDWEAAHRRLGRQIEELRALRDARKADAEAGLWPPPRDGEAS